MIGLIWFCSWQILGIYLSRLLFPGHRLTVRMWLGSVTGTILSMWMPIIYAFFFGFGTAAHWLAAGTGLIIAALAWFYVRKRADQKPVSGETAQDRPLLYLLLPLFALWFWLVWSHTLRPADGSMFTGQCTYGDMAMHLGFITSLAEQQTFPPCYSILPGTPIAYPFLCDSVSASLYLLGTSLRWAYMVPMFFAFLQFCSGFWFIAAAVCRKKNAPILAFLLFFLNGGLGMIYFLRDYTLRDLFTGFYKTPTNLVEKGMRWVNVIADMLLPQRATLFGWAALSAALYLLFLAVFRDQEAAWFPAGIIGGALPMIHTHSFFALGLVAFCWMTYTAVRDRLSSNWFRHWIIFGVTAVILAFPQLWIWTFRSVGGNASFLRLNFDWVNGGSENWFWFWLKNVGPLFVITPAAFLFTDKENRAICSGSLLIFVLCELVVFQPNIYDNNKLLYVGYLFCCLLCSDAILGWLEKIRSGRVRALMLAFFLILSLNAGVFTLIREALSGIPKYGYQLFSADEAAAADYIRENSEPAAVFLTDDNHDNPVAVLSGRNIVCGSGSYLFFHGLDYGYQRQCAERMLTDAAAFERYKDEFSVDYVYMGYYERAMNGSIDSYLYENYPAVFNSGGITIYSVRQCP